MNIEKFPICGIFTQVWKGSMGMKSTTSMKIYISMDKNYEHGKFLLPLKSSLGLKKFQSHKNVPRSWKNFLSLEKFHEFRKYQIALELYTK